MAAVAAVEEVAGVAASAPAAAAVAEVAVVAAAVGVALERSNMPTRHISTPQSLNRSRLQ